MTNFLQEEQEEIKKKSENIVDEVLRKSKEQVSKDKEENESKNANVTSQSLSHAVR